MKCPICKGKGELAKSWGNKPDNRIMTKLLRKEGYSFREIMKFLNYKSPNSIRKLLNKNEYFKMVIW